MPIDEMMTAVDEQQRTDGGEAEAPKGGDYTGPGNAQDVFDLPEDTVAALKSICKKMDARERTARLQQVARCQKARFFWRGQQYVTRKKDNEVYSVNPITTPLWATGTGADDAPKATLNIYLGYGKTFVATFSQTPCGVRFEPNDPLVERQVEAAKEADSMRKIVCKINAQKDIQKKVARLAWTDGLIVFYARNVTDGSKFGVDADGNPRNYPEIEVGGALEWKVPIACGDFDEWDYARRQKEISLSRAKSAFPAKKDDIKAGIGGLGGDLDLSRQARISTQEGITAQGNQSQSGDAAGSSVTETYYWLRPSSFEDADDENQKQFLKQYFPSGAFVCFMGETYVQSRDEDMADHLTPLVAVDGEGFNCPGLGDTAIDPQEIYNNLANISKDCFERTIPHSYFDKNIIPPEVINDQKSGYGYQHPVDVGSESALESHFYTEPTVNPPAALAGYAENLQGPLTQFLTGQQPALFGGQMGKDDRVGVYSQAREMALGLMGLVWVPFKTAWAQVMRQCVRIASDSYGEGTVLATIIDGEVIKVNVDNMKGYFLTSPDTDESFPETWSAKKAQFQELMAGSAQNEELGAILMHPDNLRMAKNLMGLDDLTIPGADSCDKQMQEIDEMETVPPTPDPMAVQQAQQVAAQNGVELTPEMLQGLPMKSSIDLGKYDDHMAEFTTCVRWLNSPTGQKAKREAPAWYQNVELHADAHKVEIDKAQQAPEQKPPSESINFKDLPPSGQAQMAGQAGIQLDPNELAAQQAQDQAAAMMAKAPKQ